MSISRCVADKSPGGDGIGTGQVVDGFPGVDAVGHDVGVRGCADVFIVGVGAGGFAGIGHGAAGERFQVPFRGNFPVHGLGRGRLAGSGLIKQFVVAVQVVQDVVGEVEQSLHFFGNIAGFGGPGIRRWP